MFPRIALLTDFGARDFYVGAIKGVLASRCQATLFDLTHEIAPFDVVEAAFHLAAVHVSFSDTLFVAVVDPGVGSKRSIVYLEQGTNAFLAPDNGLLTRVAADSSAAWLVENDALFLPAGSSTFHGRDRFAPVAAALASGLPRGQLGRTVEASTLVRIPYRHPDYRSDGAVGSVIGIDRFGNVVTDLEVARLPTLARVRVTVPREVTGSALHYAEREGSLTPYVIAGSRGTLEISVSRARAADLLHLRLLDPIELQYQF